MRQCYYLHVSEIHACNNQLFCVIVINCGLLPDPDSGLVDMSNGTTFGSIAMYTCQMAADSRTCGADGSWTSAEPNCQGKT